MTIDLNRRTLLAAASTAAGMQAAGCAAGPPAAPPAGAGSALRPWRTVQGGFLGSAAPLVGGPVRPGSGAFVRLVFPSALAVRDNELLIVDSGVGRLYRCDIAFNTLLPLAGAPATPLTRVALGPDLSAYVLDVPARRVLRFARDGRLLQTLRADGVATGGASAIAAGASDMYLLDVAAGVVHRVAADGAIRASFGQAQFSAPSGLAVDRFERVYVIDPAAGRIHVFADGTPDRSWSAVELGVQRIGGVAVDGDQLAVADLGTGIVNLFRLGAPP